MCRFSSQFHIERERKLFLTLDDLNIRKIKVSYGMLGN